MELKMRLRTFETIWRVCVIILDHHFALSFCTQGHVHCYRLQDTKLFKKVCYSTTAPPCKPLPRWRSQGPLVPWGCHPDRCWACHQIRQVLVWQVLVSAVTSFQRVNTMVRSRMVRLGHLGRSWTLVTFRVEISYAILKDGHGWNKPWGTSMWRPCVVVCLWFIFYLTYKKIPSISKAPKIPECQEISHNLGNQ